MILVNCILYFFLIKKIIGPGSINGGANDPPGHLVKEFNATTNYITPIDWTFEGCTSYGFVCPSFPPSISSFFSDSSSSSRIHLLLLYFYVQIMPTEARSANGMYARGIQRHPAPQQPSLDYYNRRVRVCVREEQGEMIGSRTRGKRAKRGRIRKEKARVQN